MSKINYLYKRIVSMDYSQFFNVLKTVKRRTKKPYIIVFIDIVYSGLKYQAGYIDYLDFELYSVPHKKRNTFITRGINNEYVKKLNNLETMKLLKDKTYFLNENFDLTKRAWINLKTVSFEEYKEFAIANPIIIAKPIDGICGRGIFKYDQNEISIDAMYDDMINNQRYLLEPYMIQHPVLMKLHPNSLNSLRIVTIRIDGTTTIPFACLRCGNGKVVDNLNSGGFAARIDIDTGIIDSNGVGKYNTVALTHPITGVAFKGLEIPHFKKALELALEASKRVPNLGYVGWDIAILEDGPIIIEGNEFPGHDIYQSPEFLGEAQIGYKPLFDSIIYKDNRTK